MAFVRFMSGPWGRALRIVVGTGLIAGAALSGGWEWLLALPGLLFLVTGVMNYCPAGLMVQPPKNRSEFMASLKPTNLIDR